MNICRLVKELEVLRRQHYFNHEDCRYTCPKHPDGCCDDSKSKDICNCGADKHNAFLDNIICMIREVYPQFAEGCEEEHTIFKIGLDDIDW